MGLQRSEGTLEELLQHVDTMASELRIIRRTIETLLKRGVEEDLVPTDARFLRETAALLREAMTASRRWREPFFDRSRGCGRPGCGRFRLPDDH